LQNCRGQRDARAFVALPAFDSCTRHELAVVDALTTELRVPGGRVLVHEGCPARELMLLLAGRVGLVRADKEVQVVGKGAWIGAPEVFSNGVHEMSAIALTDVSILASSRREAVSLVNAIPRLAAHLVVQRLTPSLVDDISASAVLAIGVRQ
jgi:CRP-like cAMP-binding protein